MITRLSFLMFALVFLSACAHVETRLPVPSAAALRKESNTQEHQAFIRYAQQLSRLDKISTKLLQANAPICEKTFQDMGVRTHTLKSYPKHLRDAAKRQLGAKKHPTILSVRDNAQLSKMDSLLDQRANPTSVRNKALQETLKTEQAEIQIRRGDKTLSVPVTSNLACDYKVSLRMSGAVNAYATGKSIIITTAMMDFAKTDEELALVVGHELAHNTMGHILKIIQNTILSGFATRTTRPFEAEADYVGLYYMARAGYNMDGVETFWRRLGVKNPKSIVRAKSHPVTPARLLSIRMTAQEINAKRTSGQALLPNALKPTQQNP